jgi:hypothetical protein
MWKQEDDKSFEQWTQKLGRDLPDFWNDFLKK